MPLKPNIPGMLWSYLKNKIRYLFSFKSRISELSEANVVYGLTDHPLDKDNSPLGSIFNVHKKYFTKVSYSIQEVKLKNQNKNVFDFTCNGYNIYKKKKMPEGVQEMYPLPGFKSKQTKLSLRIIFIQPGIYRVLCTLGPTIPNHNTEMIYKDIADNSFSAKCTEEDDFYRIQTSELTLKIYKTDFRILVYNSTGKLITESSGYSKNHFPSSTDSLPLGIVKVRKKKKIYGTESFIIYPDEAIYGFGERYSSLNKVGQTISLWNWEGCGNSGGRSYKNIPFFLSTRGYGVFFNESRPITFWIGSREYNKTFVAVEGDLVDYFFFYGPDPKRVLFNYTELTGKSPVPPKWSFGAWMSRISYKSQEEVLSVAKKLREQKYPFDVICIDTEWFTEDWHCDWKFDRTRFPDPVAMCNELEELGFRLSLWQSPYIMSDLPEYKEVKKKKLAAKNHGPFIFLANPAVALDFSNPEAVKWYQEKLRNLFEIGADVIKIDFGEQIEPHMEFQKYSGREMHNLYSMLYQKAAFDITKEFFGEGIIWARSAYAGSQRYPVHWSGDSSSSFEEMLNVLRGGLSLGLCGFSYWSQDVGGFIFSPTDKLYIRWTQFGIFNSHMRYHGNPPRYREPWNYNEDTQKIVREFLNLRYRMIPYIYTEAHYSSQKGLPMLKPLVLEYFDDPNVFNIESEYLFGRNLLIAPILSREDERRIYLPEGEWYEFWSFEKYDSKTWIDYECPIDRTPFFIKAGTILPLGPIVQNLSDKKLEELETLTLLILPDENNKVDNYEIIDENNIEIEAEIRESVLDISISEQIQSITVEIPLKTGIKGIKLNGNELSMKKLEHKVVAK